jgi:hypothetical protein
VAGQIQIDPLTIWEGSGVMTNTNTAVIMAVSSDGDVRAALTPVPAVAVSRTTDEGGTQKVRTPHLGPVCWHVHCGHRSCRRIRNDRPKRWKQTPQFTSDLCSMIRGLGRRVGDRGDVENLAQFARVAAETDAQLRYAVAALRAGPWNYSWEEIGRALGITRQAAQIRFGKDRP